MNYRLLIILLILEIIGGYYYYSSTFVSLGSHQSKILIPDHDKITTAHTNSPSLSDHTVALSPVPELSSKPKQLSKTIAATPPSPPEDTLQAYYDNFVSKNTLTTYKTWKQLTLQNQERDKQQLLRQLLALKLRNSPDTIIFNDLKQLIDNSTDVNQIRNYLFLLEDNATPEAMQTLIEYYNKNQQSIVDQDIKKNIQEDILNTIMQIIKAPHNENNYSSFATQLEDWRNDNPQKNQQAYLIATYALAQIGNSTQLNLLLEEAENTTDPTQKTLLISALQANQNPDSISYLGEQLKITFNTSTRFFVAYTNLCKQGTYRALNQVIDYIEYSNQVYQPDNCFGTNNLAQLSSADIVLLKNRLDNLSNLGLKQTIQQNLVISH